MCFLFILGIDIKGTTQHYTTMCQPESRDQSILSKLMHLGLSARQANAKTSTKASVTICTGSRYILGGRKRERERVREGSQHRFNIGFKTNPHIDHLQSQTRYQSSEKKILIVGFTPSNRTNQCIWMHLDIIQLNCLRHTFPNMGKGAGGILLYISHGGLNQKRLYSHFQNVIPSSIKLLLNCQTNPTSLPYHPSDLEQKTGGRYSSDITFSLRIQES